jgi:hypothetical protein
MKYNNIFISMRQRINRRTAGCGSWSANSVYGCEGGSSENSRFNDTAAANKVVD